MVADSSLFVGRGGEELIVVDASQVAGDRAGVIGTIPTEQFPGELQCILCQSVILLETYPETNRQFLPSSGLKPLYRISSFPGLSWRDGKTSLGPGAQQMSEQFQVIGHDQRVATDGVAQRGFQPVAEGRMRERAAYMLLAA